MVWLPDSEKILEIYLFVSTESTNVMDGQTDGQTPHDGIGRDRAAKTGVETTVCSYSEEGTGRLTLKCMTLFTRCDHMERTTDGRRTDNGNHRVSGREGRPAIELSKLQYA